MIYLRRIFLLITTSALMLSGYSQKISKETVTGKVLADNGRTPLKAATVALYTVDTILITYGLTNESGSFKIAGVPKQVDCRLVITHMGYKIFRKIVRLNGPLNIGEIFLNPDTANLAEVIITAERPPVIIRNDTIEFDAKAFKTLPGAVLEDLLKKLPGVDLDIDGSVFVRGRPVNRILVEGKYFFGGQSNIALKNLPSDIVDKVQVADDKEQIRKNPDIKPADVGQVINITLKNGIKKGAFGKVFAGKDAEDHYEAGGLVNIFRDTFQLSLVGYSNNVNKPGFALSDIQTIGGFNRNSSSNSVSITGSGYSINGVSLGATGQGIQKSEGVGINHNNQIGKDLRVNMLYFYGNVDAELHQLSKRSQFISDTILSSASDGYRTGRDQYHRISVSLDWQMDSSTTITFNPYLNIRRNDVQYNSEMSTRNEVSVPINESSTNDLSKEKETNYSHSLNLNKSFRNKYKILSINHSLSNLSGSFNQFSKSLSRFFEDGSIDDSLLIDQYRKRPVKNFYTTTSVYYSHPLAKFLSATLSGSMAVFTDKQDILTLGKNGQTGKYDEYLENFSNTLDRNGSRNNVTPGLTIRLKNLSISGGVNFSWIRIDNKMGKNGIIHQSYFYKLPQANLSWKKINFSYQPVITEPSAFELQTVVDNSNPLYQQIGNPDLRPTSNHRLTLSFFDYDFKRQRQLSIFASGSFTENAIIRERNISSIGIQTSRPVNINGIKSMSLSGSFGNNYKFGAKWRLQLRPSLTYTYSEGILLLNYSRSTYASWALIPGMQLLFNWNDRIEFSPKYNLSFRKTNREKNAYVRNKVITHNLESLFTIRPLKKLIIDGTVSYRFNPEVSPGIPQSITIINAGIAAIVLKEKGLVKLSVNDLFNQNTTVTRFTSENFVYETSSNSLRRYVMLTIQYNIREFRK